MGISLFKVSSCTCESATPVFEPKPVYIPPRKSLKDAIKDTISRSMGLQPDPRNFEIERAIQGEQWAIVQVRYPDVDNFEGRKILMYNTTVEEVEAQTYLDPHFCMGGHLSPFARFEPTDDGWNAAIELAKVYKL